jgi:hypothetical protein
LVAGNGVRMDIEGMEEGKIEMGGRRIRVWLWRV